MAGDVDDGSNASPGLVRVIIAGGMGRAASWVGGALLILAIFVGVKWLLVLAGVSSGLAFAIALVAAVSIVEPNSYLRQAIRRASDSRTRSEPSHDRAHETVRSNAFAGRYQRRLLWGAGIWLAAGLALAGIATLGFAQRQWYSASGLLICAGAALFLATAMLANAIGYRRLLSAVEKGGSLKFVTIAERTSDRWLIGRQTFVIALLDRHLALSPTRIRASSVRIFDLASTDIELSPPRGVRIRSEKEILDLTILGDEMAGFEHALA